MAAIWKEVDEETLRAEVFHTEDEVRLHLWKLNSAKMEKVNVV